MIEALLQAERSLTVGQLDAAERVYRHTILADPRNSIAVVGLARVALERGDEVAAHGFARRALEIDGDNVAARRLLLRLEEVMRQRGDQPPLATGDPGPESGQSMSGEQPAGAADPVAEPAPSTQDAAPRPPRTTRRPGLFRRILGR
jgi:hypothetical protein